MSRSDDRIGLKSGWFLTVMPYSVSIPMTFGMAISPHDEEKPPATRVAGGRGVVGGPGARGGPRAPQPLPRALQVLAGIDHALDVALLFLGLAHERLHVDDPLALLAGDLGPVVGVGGVGQVLVLLELLPHRRQQVVRADPLVPAPDVALQGQLLGPPHYRLDHRTRR